MILKNRIELLEHIPKGGICVEIGVDMGYFAQEIYRTTKPKYLWLIDPFPYEYQLASVDSLFRNSHNVKTIIGFGFDYLTMFENDLLDFVYEDADHSLETTYKHLSLAFDKVKSGGFICGHDFCEGYFDDRPHVDKYIKFGVIEAVHQFCQNFNQKIYGITADLDGKFSYMIKVSK